MPKIAPNDQLGEGKASAATPSLQSLEEEIKNGQGDYVAVGTALTAIQSTRLYKPLYNTFEEYCEKRWGFVRKTAYEYIRAAAIQPNVTLTLQNIPSFTQAVELARLEPEQQKEIAASLDFASATVKDVKAAVDRVVGKMPEPKTPEPKETTLEEIITEFVNKLAMKIVMQPHGYSAAKFAKYPHQHVAELELIALAKRDIYRIMGEICQKNQ